MKIKVTIEGITPLLMHKFDPQMLVSKQKSKDLTVEKQAEDLAYRNKKGELYIPGFNIYRTIIEGGRFVKDGKAAITNMKRSKICAAGTLVEDECLLGQTKYEIFATSAVNGALKARVMVYRPMFKKWKLDFTLEMDDTILSSQKIKDCIEQAGKSVGLGSYRPDCKGTYGKFKVTSFNVVK